MHRPGPPKYAYIDSLRGFAILAVVVLHVRNSTHALPEPLAAVALQGQRGVQLFFLVSALTLVMSMRARVGRESRPTVDFFVRRFFRIAPMFWFAIALYLIRDGWDSRWGAPDGITPGTVLLTATFLHGWAPENVNGVVPGGWTIAAEMMFYLLLPLLFRLTTSLTRALWLAAITAVAAVALGSLATAVLMPTYPPSSQYLVSWFVRYWFPAQLPVFAMGICLAFIVGRPVADPRQRSVLAIAAAGLLVVAMSFGGYEFLSPDLLYGAALALFVWGLSVVPWKFFVNAATRYLGLVSYSVYLLHFTVVDIVSFQLLRTGLTGLPLFIIALVLTVAISTAVASVTYAFIERPGIALGARIVRRIEGSRTVALQPADSPT